MALIFMEFSFQQGAEIIIKEIITDCIKYQEKDEQDALISNNRQNSTAWKLNVTYLNDQLMHGVKLNPAL